VLRSIAPELWVTERPLRFFGVEIGARMSVVRLASGALWLHSPVESDARLREELAELGPIRFVVAPNRLHHLFVGGWADAGAELHVAPGLAAKRPDLAGPTELADEAPTAWSEEIDQALIEGFPLANEVVFFHRRTATLIATDIAINLGPGSSALTGLLLKSWGAYGRLSTTPLERVAVRDRPATRRSIERVLEWPFERVIVAHGSVIERGGRDALRQAWQWLLEAGPRS